MSLAVSAVDIINAQTNVIIGLCHELHKAWTAHTLVAQGRVPPHKIKQHAQEAADEASILLKATLAYVDALHPDHPMRQRDKT